MRKHRRRSLRKATLIVEHVLRLAVVDNWQRSAFTPNLENAINKSCFVVSLSQAIQPFGYRAVHSTGHRFARKARKLLSAPMGFFVLDIQAHWLW